MEQDGRSHYLQAFVLLSQVFVLSETTARSSFTDAFSLNVSIVAFSVLSFKLVVCNTPTGVATGNPDVYF